MPADLLWPNSVYAYASMRREAHVAAILAGWTLQLRRAQWQIDGTGCRPDIVQLVADDLGLPVKGQDQPKAARVHGVSWHEHLRAALLALTYGHSGFELQATVVDGRARLAGLWERPPWTIGEIHVDPKSGAFLGITQDSPAGSNRPPQIRADRMAWYCREREGANWSGVSLLRPVWPLTLIKREMLKVHAIANRRWSAGVSTVRALPGTNPTPAQHAAAAEWAQQARAGDQAGGSLPPGFIHEIVGMSGSTPDTLAFVRYLDEAAARACLTQYLHLGSTSTGSRALGETFVDNLMLALESEAAFVCDVATRQVAARIVEWNAGPDEPVPQVTSSGIGSHREVTAESLQLLMSSGALSADPGLEEWVRREYRLPEREGERRSPHVPGVDLNRDETPGADDGEPATARPVEAASRRRKRGELEGQLALPVAAATTDPADAEWQQAREDLKEQWPTAAGPIVAAVVAGAVAAAVAGTLAAPIAVGVEATAAAVDAVASAMTALAELSARRTVTELAAVDVTVSAGTVDERRIRDTAAATVQVVADGYVTAARRALLLHAGADEAEVESAVRGAVDEMTAAGERGWVAQNLAGALSAAQHGGRVATYEQVSSDAAVVWVADEAGEPSSSRCKPCDDIDGATYETLAEALEDYPAGRYRWCEGRERCRGRLAVARAGDGGR